MKKTTGKAISSRPRAGYSSLIERFPLRPLRDDSDLDSAIAVLNDLIDRDSLDSGEEDYLEILGDVIAKYENLAHPVPEISGEEMLRFLIVTNGLTQAEVAAGTGIHVTTVSQILSGKRPLRLPQVQALANYFGLGAAAFLSKYERDSGDEN